MKLYYAYPTIFESDPTEMGKESNARSIGILAITPAKDLVVVEEMFNPTIWESFWAQVAQDKPLDVISAVKGNSEGDPDSISSVRTHLTNGLNYIMGKGYIFIGLLYLDSQSSDKQISEEKGLFKVRKSKEFLNMQDKYHEKADYPLLENKKYVKTQFLGVGENFFSLQSIAYKDIAQMSSFFRGNLNGIMGVPQNADLFQFMILSQNITKEQAVPDFVLNKHGRKTLINLIKTGEFSPVGGFRLDYGFDALHHLPQWGSLELIPEFNELILTYQKFLQALILGQKIATPGLYKTSPFDKSEQTSPEPETVTPPPRPLTTKSSQTKQPISQKPTVLFEDLPSKVVLPTTDLKSPSQDAPLPIDSTTIELQRPTIAPKEKELEKPNPELQKPTLAPIGTELEKPTLELEKPTSAPKEKELEKPTLELQKPTLAPMGTELEKTTIASATKEIEKLTLTQMGIELEKPTIASVTKEIEKLTLTQMGIDLEKPKLDLQKPPIVPKKTELEKPKLDFQKPTIAPMNADLEKISIKPTDSELKNLTLEPIKPQRFAQVQSHSSIDEKDEYEDVFQRSEEVQPLFDDSGNKKVLDTNELSTMIKDGTLFLEGDLGYAIDPVLMSQNDILKDMEASLAALSQLDEISQKQQAESRIYYPPAPFISSATKEGMQIGGSTCMLSMGTGRNIWMVPEISSEQMWGSFFDQTEVEGNPQVNEFSIINSKEINDKGELEELLLNAFVTLRRNNHIFLGLICLEGNGFETTVYAENELISSDVNKLNEIYMSRRDTTKFPEIAKEHWISMQYYGRQEAISFLMNPNATGALEIATNSIQDQRFQQGIACGIICVDEEAGHFFMLSDNFDELDSESPSFQTHQETLEKMFFMIESSGLTPVSWCKMLFGYQSLDEIPFYDEIKDGIVTRMAIEKYQEYISKLIKSKKREDKLSETGTTHIPDA